MRMGNIIRREEETHNGPSPYFTHTKKVVLGISLAIALGVVINKNRKQAGIIANQKATIDGLLRDIKNLSYHLGKKITK